LFFSTMCSVRVLCTQYMLKNWSLFSGASSEKNEEEEKKDQSKNAVVEKVAFQPLKLLSKLHSLLAAYTPQTLYIYRPRVQYCTLCSDCVLACVTFPSTSDPSSGDIKIQWEVLGMGKMGEVGTGSD
jgi:hypothetical protein